MNVRQTEGRPAGRALGWLGLATAGLTLAACVRGDQGARLAAEAPGPPECPWESHDGRESHGITVVGARGERTIKTIALSQPIANIPEFHDCQRFVVVASDGQPKYDGLYAIYATYREGRDTFPTNRDVPVATIYTDEGTYAPLGIEPGFNCLLLRRTSTGWHSRMVPRQADENCIHAVEPGLPAKSLDVDTLRIPDVPFAGTEYPGAARWDWDADNKEQYIGITCGASWCEVGDSGFKTSAPYPGPPLIFDSIPNHPLAPEVARRVTEVKGWYDAQVLDSVSAVTGDPVPTGIYGWLVPNPALYRLSSTDPKPGLDVFRRRWVHVASAWLSGDYKHNLRKGENKIYLCHQLPADTLHLPADSLCQVPFEQQPLSPHHKGLRGCTADHDDGGMWWAKVRSSNGEVRYMCVERRSHHAQIRAYKGTRPPARPIRIPVGARWRWQLQDAGEWAKCGSGCCTGQ
jgi:hypothetical protein